MCAYLCGRARQRQEAEKLRDQADMHSRALTRAEALAVPVFPSFTSWNIEGAPPQPMAAPAKSPSSPSRRDRSGAGPAATQASTALSGGQYGFGSRVCVMAVAAVRVVMQSGVADHADVCPCAGIEIRITLCHGATRLGPLCVPNHPSCSLQPHSEDPSHLQTRLGSRNRRRLE